MHPSRRSLTSTLPLSPSVFAIIGGLIEAHSGLHYGPEDRDLLAQKLSERAIEAGFESLLDYYYFLRYDPAGPEALAKLIESLLVQETYFFREAEPLEILCDTHLAPMVQRGLRPRVWSAACATGEEPLTLTMMLDDRGLLGKVELIASDLSARALARAQQGDFRKRSVRALPTGVIGRWLEPLGEERYRVDRRLIEAVQWKRANLSQPEEPRSFGSFDAILCRNVLIYFSDTTTTGVVRLLASQLRPGGLVLVGTSESLVRFGGDLEVEERRGSFFYRRPDR